MTAGAVGEARRLAWLTLLYNLFEAVVCAAFGVQDHSLSLLGFGGDSLIEASSAGVILWRFGGAAGEDPPESRIELKARKLIATLLIALATFLAASAWFVWRSGVGPRSGLPGVWIALLSLAVMAWLYRRKRACARLLHSKALEADAFCTLSCMWLSGILLLGSALFAGTRLALFEAAASAIMALLIVKQGIDEYDEADLALWTLEKGG